MNKELKQLIQKQDEELYKLLSNPYTIQNVINLFWEGITETYVLGLNEASMLGALEKPIALKKLKNLTYDNNSTKTENRIRGHIELCYPTEKVKDNTKLKPLESAARQAQFALLMRLFNNEIEYIYNNVIKLKMQETAREKKIDIYFEIISDNCCGGCLDIGANTYHINEIDTIGIPPYHPDCHCTINWMMPEEQEERGY